MPSERDLSWEYVAFSNRPISPLPASQRLVQSTEPVGDDFFGEVAVVAFDGGRETLTLAIERHQRAQVDRAGETAFDELGRLVLEDVHAA